jgi:hypothetical protein
MTLRHAAALALVGWYLMVPPVYQRLRASPVPLSKWVVNGRFDSAKKCDEAATKHSAELVKRSPRAAVDYAETYLCVSTDDRRLKGK